MSSGQKIALAFALLVGTAQAVSVVLVASNLDGESMYMSKADFLTQVEAMWDNNPYSDCRSPWFIWESVSSTSVPAEIYSDTRVCFNLDFTTWRDSHNSDNPGYFAPALKTAARWKVTVPSAGLDEEYSGELIRAVMHGEEAWPGSGALGLHYKRQNSGEHFPWWNSQGGYHGSAYLHTNQYGVALVGNAQTTHRISISADVGSAPPSGTPTLTPTAPPSETPTSAPTPYEHPCANDEVVMPGTGECRKICDSRRRLSSNFGPEFSSDTSGDGPSLQHMRRLLGDEDCVDVEDANGNCPTPVTASATGAICFTGDSLLTLEDGTTKKFHELEVGMSVAGADRNGTISYSQVIFNPHPYNTGTHYFDEVVTANGKTVRLTRNHLIPTCNGGLVTARSLQPGDCVQTVDGEEKVAKVTQNVEASGIYTAVTENEFLVVDGVVASPFALAHGIAHSLFDREDVTEWCKDNAHLVPAAKDEEVKDIVLRRRLTEGDATTGCVDLMETLFENYKDEGVGWGTNGFGYKNFKTIRGGAKTSLPMRLSGFA